MEKVFNYTFKNVLQVEPDDHPVFLTDVLNNTKASREKMIELMFETFNIPSYYVALQPYLSLISSGIITGVSLEIGDGVTQIVPFIRAYAVPNAIMRLDFAGHYLTLWLQKILEEGKYNIAQKEKIALDIKKNYTYVALDYEAELQKAKNSSECDLSFILPDDKSIKIADERFRCTELLFKPHLNGFDLDGIDKNLINSIMKCNVDIKKDNYVNIILSGGSTMFRGFKERIGKEKKNSALPNKEIKVTYNQNGMNPAWIGGSRIASVGKFEEMLIYHDDYIHCGPEVVHRHLK